MSPDDLLTIIILFPEFSIVRLSSSTVNGWGMVSFKSHESTFGLSVTLNLNKCGPISVVVKPGENVKVTVVLIP